MASISQVQAGADRVTAALMAGLECEFGAGAGAALATRFMAAEEADFCWEARQEERWLGAFEDADDDGLDLDRLAVWGRLGGRWFVAQLIVDGDGCAHAMLGKREFGSVGAARRAFADAY